MNYHELLLESSKKKPTLVGDVATVGGGALAGNLAGTGIAATRPKTLQTLRVGLKMANRGKSTAKLKKMVSRLRTSNNAIIGGTTVAGGGLGLKHRIDKRKK